MDDVNAAAADAPAPPPDPLEQLIERWWADHFPGSILAQHTEVWNYVAAAVGELKRLLKQGSN